jgi:hypothetical protein
MKMKSGFPIWTSATETNMKALIEIEMGNAAFGNNEAERLFELRQVTERLIDNATHIMAANAGDYASAQDTNGNTVARLHIVED